MSYQIGIDRINLRPTPRLGHMEYRDNDEILRWAYKQKYGCDMDPKRDWNEGRIAFEEIVCIDADWLTHDGIIEWRDAGRATDMGHAEWLEGGVDYHKPQPSPFKDVEEVYEFDAVKEYGLPDFKEQVAAYETMFTNKQKANPHCVATGGYYRTLVSGAIDSFGWDMLLQAAADKDRFEQVLETFFQRTLFFVKAWAETSIEVFIQHDDMVWTQGAFMRPDFYRRAIFPRYAKLWKVLHDAGKKVLFCSDGDFTQFLPDIAEAGADGFIFEPMTSLEAAIGPFGKTHVIIGSKVDCRTMSFGTKEEIKAEIDATLALAKDCPGFFFAVGNHLPANIPLENLLFYFDYLMKNWNTEG